jgi:pimeloyl-ACP methyl ester carboxylesterase
MEKFSITNRYGFKIVGDLHIPENPAGLAFVLHGLGDFKEQGVILHIADTFFKNNYTVINFDATNSFNESGGKYEDATMQKHYEDLVYVITWAKDQTWYQEPFILAGHSLGGYAVTRYAEDFPKEVKAIFPHALAVSGELSHKANIKYQPQKLKTWKDTGWIEMESESKPGLIKRLPYSHLEERLQHDLLPHADKLTMPVLFMVGENDTSCPPDHQKIFHDALPKSTEREFHIIKGASHTFRTSEHLAELGSILDAWIKKLK